MTPMRVVRNPETIAGRGRRETWRDPPSRMRAEARPMESLRCVMPAHQLRVLLRGPEAGRSDTPTATDPRSEFVRSLDNRTPPAGRRVARCAQGLRVSRRCARAPDGRRFASRAPVHTPHIRHRLGGAGSQGPVRTSRSSGREGREPESSSRSPSHPWFANSQREGETPRKRFARRGPTARHRDDTCRATRSAA
jgi:hypothetical protein